MPAADSANKVIGAQRNNRSGSQRNANQLQKAPSAIGSAKAPKADSFPRRAKLPSAKSVARAIADVQRESLARAGSRARSRLSRLGHPRVARSPSRPRWVTVRNQVASAHGQLPNAPARACRAVTSTTAAGRIRA